jgi:hypothetical protein
MPEKTMDVGELRISRSKSGCKGDQKRKSTLKVSVHGSFLCQCGSNHRVTSYTVYNGNIIRTEEEVLRVLRNLKNNKIKECQGNINVSL